LEKIRGRNILYCTGKKKDEKDETFFHPPTPPGRVSLPKDPFHGINLNFPKFGILSPNFFFIQGFIKNVSIGSTFPI